MSFRTDLNNNPAAFICNIAQQAKLVYGVDYEQGTSFEDAGVTYYTAKLLGDPVALTIRVIDAIGYKTLKGIPRWSYIDLPKFVWNSQTYEQKRDIVGYHYMHEGGVEMRDLFPNYGTL